MIAYRTIDCPQDTHHTLRVQFHGTTPRVDWLEQIETLKMRVSPYLIAYRCHRDTHHALQVQIYRKTLRMD